MKQMALEERQQKDHITEEDLKLGNRDKKQLRREARMNSKKADSEDE